MKYHFQIHRDVDTWHYRKVVLELYLGETMIDRCRIIAGIPFLSPVMELLWLTFARRLEWRKATMLKRARIIVAASRIVDVT